MTLRQAKKLAKNTLSSHRYRHVANVKKAAVTLAKRYDADAKKAGLAAWLHDIAKEMPRERLLQLMGQDAIIAQALQHKPEILWHGPCAAVYARQDLGVTDDEVLDAVAFHTTGRPGMSRLDKIIYLADTISKERNYPGVAELRRLSKTNLDKAVLEAMRQKVYFVTQKGRPVDEMTTAAISELEMQCKGRREGG